MGIKKETEKSFMQSVIDYARLKNLLVYHTHDSRKSASGFPDLVIVGRVTIFAELKLDGKEMTPSQQLWKSKLELAGENFYLWYPSDWPEIVKVLDDISKSI